MNLQSIRRALAAKGLTAAAVGSDPGAGRLEDFRIRPARLVEGSNMESHAVGPAQTWPGPLAYLHGVQRSVVIGYAGAAPLLVGEIGAAMRERRHRRLHTVLEEHEWVALGRPVALHSAGDAIEGLTPVAIPEDEPAHPIRDQMNASRALDRRRLALEIALVDRYRSRSDTWIVVDGTLSDSPRWTADSRMVAVVKSHSILPFEGRDLERYLRLPQGHRSSVYAPESRSLAPLLAWGLRLWPWEGKDLLHGLVRVEVAPANGSAESADAISRWILAERAPVCAPDRQWDRLLYGLHSVEQYLKARSS
jgi:hypothetical protein